jgi:heme-degrading monooxygenase HmoA
MCSALVALLDGGADDQPRLARVDDGRECRHLRGPAAIGNLPGIVAKKIAGFERIELFRRELGAEVEFMTVMWFTSLEAVKAFAGEDHEAAYVPARARAVLARFDDRSRHYEVRAAVQAARA